MPRTTRTPGRYEPTPRRPPSAVEPVTVNLRRAPAASETAWHNHPWGQLIFAVSGTLRLATADAAWVVPPYRAIWIPPRVEHQAAILSDADFRTLYVDTGTSPLPLDACRVMDVSPLMGALIEALADPEPPAEPRRGLILALLVEEMRLARPLALGLSLPQDRRLLSLCQALIEEPAADLSLARWAERVGASERTLTRLFRNELGMGFAAWRQQLRLSHAATLIAQGQRLGEVAGQLGYANPSAFSAMFKRAFGSPPSRFFRQQE
ncbi:AraC family transcriptional regulator [Zestomonas carbonaria]|uniref:HTH-type transcriptional regulator NimR n=1 Tax=Zestomonas carbonaria TaxID=2762745 RepID=A0A7U7EQ62_9GAMM|nr:helix-turn-helix transcriptional regulator [Pseudomonas carbonaria]CAD5109158.1 HTH-type transcriptional regulator NimR [Pseudomonas carbonaria]